MIHTHPPQATQHGHAEEASPDDFLALFGEVFDVRVDVNLSFFLRWYEDGSEYEGDWKAGEQHGVGTFRYSGKRKGMLASTLRHTGFFLAGPFVFPSFFFLVSSSVGKTGSVRRAVSRYVNAAAPD